MEGYKAGIDTYRASLRAAVRGLWKGILTPKQFREAMTSTINRRLTQAWAEGAKECGIKPADYTEEEKVALRVALENELEFITEFSEAITGAEKLEPLFRRADMWVNRYRDFKNRAKVLACSDKKLQWVIGPTEQHCKDCSGYNGKVYRGSVWAKKDIRPQHPNLSCHGFRCLCQLTPTDKALTRGGPPGMTG